MPPVASTVHYGVDWGTLPFFFGVAVYCFEGVGTVVPIERSMANRKASAHGVRILAPQSWHRLAAAARAGPRTLSRRPFDRRS